MCRFGWVGEWEENRNKAVRFTFALVDLLPRARPTEALRPGRLRYSLIYLHLVVNLDTPIIYKFASSSSPVPHSSARLCYHECRPVSRCAPPA